MAEITRTFYSHLVFLFTADDHEIDVFTSKEGKPHSQMISISSAPFKSIHSLQTSEKPRCNCLSLSGEFGQRNLANI